VSFVFSHFRDRLRRACRIQFLGFILQRLITERQMSSNVQLSQGLNSRDRPRFIAARSMTRIRCHVRSRFSFATDSSFASFYSHHARRFMAPLALSLSPKVLGRSPRETLLTYFLTRRVLSRPSAEGISCKSFRIPRADFSRIAVSRHATPFSVANDVYLPSRHFSRDDVHSSPYSARNAAFS